MLLLLLLKRLYLFPWCGRLISPNVWPQTLCFSSKEVCVSSQQDINGEIFHLMSTCEFSPFPTAVVCFLRCIRMSTVADPKCCCFHWPINWLPLKSLLVFVLRASAVRKHSSVAFGFLGDEVCGVVFATMVFFVSVVPRKGEVGVEVYGVGGVGMEKVNNNMAGLETDTWARRVSLCFCYWGGDWPVSVLPSMLTHLPPHPSPPSLEQLYQHDNSVRAMGVTSPSVSFFPGSHLSRSPYFSLLVTLGITSALSTSTQTHTHTCTFTRCKKQLFFSAISPTIPASVTKIPSNCAAGWVGRAASSSVWKAVVSGQCEAVFDFFFFDPPTVFYNVL